MYLFKKRMYSVVKCASIILSLFAFFVFSALWINVETGLNTVLPKPDHMSGSLDLNFLEWNETRILTESTTVRDLLIFSYMRSGSSVTGGLFRDSPRTFYMYEPLIPQAPYSYFTDKYVCEMRDSTCSSTNAAVRIKQALLTLKQLYNCNIRAVPTSILDKLVQENKSGKHWDEFGKCRMKEKLHDPQNSTNSTTGTNCMGKLERACAEADVRVAKVLRLGFATVEMLLKTNPKLNVLFLARDPRAIINSRIKTRWFPVTEDKPESVVNNILSLCLKMETDLKALLSAKSRFKSRIMYSTLENLTANYSSMKGLFKFINRTLTTEDKQNVSKCLKKKVKRNITEKWTKELGTEYKILIHTHCHYFLNSITFGHLG